MPAARRTGDEEGRIVHGGELPEDEGSLDDVVVDKPYQKQPDELWTSYLIRRLGYEGIEVSEFECNDCNNLNSTTKLNEGVSLVLDRNVGVDPFIFKKDNKYFMTPGGRKALRKDASKNDFVRNLLYYEAITLNYNDTIEFICY